MVLGGVTLVEGAAVAAGDGAVCGDPTAVYQILTRYAYVLATNK